MKKRILAQKTKGSADVPKRLKLINRKQRHAVLATISGNKPYTSLIAFALTPDSRHILFATPKKTQKYRNILKNKNISILINTAKNTSKDYSNAEAVTIQGRAHLVSGKKRKELASVFVKKHSELRAFVSSASTALIMVKIQFCLHVSSFQQVTEWRF